MIAIPAICDNCETIFPSGIVGGGGATVMISNSKSGPCPNCGSMGYIPDGSYKLVENIIEVLSAPQRTLDELKRFANLLEKARKEEITAEELKKQAQTNIPELHPLLDWVLPRNRSEKFSFGMVILGAALNIFASALLNNQPTKDIEPEVIINNIYEIKEYNVYEINQPYRTDKVGRNEPCPCGSGTKYKKCHGG